MSLDEAALATVSPSEMASSCTDPVDASSTRRFYLRVLAVAFGLFNSARIFTYIPTIWAIHTSGDSSQHSLWTWVTWIGANATMAAWLYENNDKQFNSAITVSMANALMCLATSLMIVYFRI